MKEYFVEFHEGIKDGPFINIRSRTAKNNNHIAYLDFAEDERDEIKKFFTQHGIRVIDGRETEYLRT